jgi:tetratricopeptide (TPR) repeat protein
VLGLKCAVATNDLKWALACALGGAGNAADPTPFYRAVVAIKAAGKNVDSDLTTALEYLREHDAGRAGWAERLGQIYFEQHDPARALAILSPPITEDVRGVRVQSLLLAAESARLDGKMGKAVGLLETAHAMYPEKLTVLNNLVYNLAQDRRTLSRARALLPGLLAMAGDSFIVYDTAAAVHLRSGELETAQQYMDKALKLINENNYAALEVSLNSAEIMLRSGEYEQARRRLQEIRRNPHVTQFVDMSARQLLQELRELTGR